MGIGVAHHVTALIFHNNTRCYGKQVTVFAVAVATCDIIKYQSFIYGSFVWEFHMRYNNRLYQACAVGFRDSEIRLHRDYTKSTDYITFCKICIKSMHRLKSYQTETNILF